MSGGAEKTENVARASTRGVAMIGAAKAYFLLIGFVQPIVLTRILGKSDYGLYNSVINTISILNNVVVAGSIQGMSRAVTESGSRALRRGIVLHGALALIVGGGLALLAGPIGRGLRDPSMPTLLRVGAIIAANYSVYAALVGALNGQQRFRAQATLDMTFATVRTALIVGLAWTAWRVLGAVTGFAIASAMITLLALFTVWPREQDVRSGDETMGAFVRRYVGFFAPVLVYQLAMNIVLQADLLVLKAILAHRAGMTTERVNDVVALYKGAQAFAILPYQLLLAVTFVVFPVVSRTTLDGDRETTRRFVSGALRFSLLALGAMVAVLVGLPAGVLRVAYPADFVLGAGALRVLSLGQGAFAIAVISSTIVLAAGRTAAATLLMLWMLVAVIAGDLVGITVAHQPLDALVGAASGTTFGCVVGLLAVGAYTFRTFGAFIPPASFVRIAFATAISAVSVAIVPLHGKVVTIALAAAGTLLYASLLLLFGEVRAEERTALLRLLTRRRA